MPGEPLILDSNLLVLLTVGTASRAYISKHKRLQAYSEADFDLLVEVIAPVSKVMVTPNTLTEASNLLGQIGEPVRTHIYETLRLMIKASEEIHVESGRAVEHDEFRRLGLTDAVLLELTDSSCMLLTADLDLYLAAARRGLKVVNFNHLRDT
ncbi:MAG: PIN domain-containing protein [Stellaceae bacterium]